jgi:anti-anti-sigma regulatory factor
MMQSRIRQWLTATALTNPVEQGQASVLQIMLLLVGAFGTLLIGLLVVALLSTSGSDGDTTLVLLTLSLAVILVGCALTAVVLLRRGHFQTAVVLVAVGFTVLHNITVITTGLVNKEVLLVYLVPLTLAGLLSSRRALPAVLVIACAGIWIAALTTPTTMRQPSGILMPSDPSPPAVTAFNFTLIIGIIGIFFAVFGNVLSDALARSVARERELEELRRGLEQTVGERTVELRTAIAEVEARADQETKLRREAEEQRALVRGMSVPVLPVSANTLVVPLVGNMDAQRLNDLNARTLSAAERTRCKRLVLDITGVAMVNTQVAEGLVQVMHGLRLLGTEAVLVGIRPEVAQTLVGLGVNLRNLSTFADLQTALQSDTQRSNPTYAV